jgi:hypothetical protein
MKASSTCFRVASLVLVLGMIWGIVMGASGNHETKSAHAHFNLLGWASLFLIGVFYRLHPAIDDSGAARLQLRVWIAGTVVQAIGVVMLASGQPIGEPVAILGSLALLAGAALFGRLVYTRAGG